MNILDQAFDEPALAINNGVVGAVDWSGFQTDIFSAISGTAFNLVIQAVAGSGKTTTLVEGMKYAGRRALFMAFNKSIALDIQKKVGAGGMVKTLNALGHWQYMQNRPGAQLNARKVSELFKEVMMDEDYREYGYSLARVIGLAKNNALGLSDSSAGNGEQPVFELDPEHFSDIIDKAQLDIPLERQAEFSQLCATIMKRSIEMKDVLDFDDQLYMPAHEHWEYPSYDTVFVDEAQDLSPIQHVMLERLAAKGARIIAVGDRHQAIYGFRGALHDSMDQLKEKFSMQELPLSVCYRCDKEIVHEAQIYCPTIIARAGAGAGQVIVSEDRDPELFGSGLILCRNNAPLFRAVLRHYRAKSPCRVLSNFLESFQGFIKQFKTTYTSDLLAKLENWYNKEVEAAQKKGAKGKLAYLEDKYETVKLLAKEFKQTVDLLRAVKALGEGTSGPTFATIHKAKGLEMDEVYILRPDLMPSKWAQSPEAKQQERNLAYVAVTRAKHKLVYGEMQR